MQNMKARFQYFAEVQPDLAKQSKNTSIELYKIILNTYLYPDFIFFRVWKMRRNARR